MMPKDLYEIIDFDAEGRVAEEIRVADNLTAIYCS